MPSLTNVRFEHSFAYKSDVTIRGSISIINCLIHRHRSSSMVFQLTPPLPPLPCFFSHPLFHSTSTQFLGPPPHLSPNNHPTMLYFIGLGLGNEKDITLRGLEAVKSCEKIFLENYTSVLGVGTEKLVHPSHWH